MTIEMTADAGAAGTHDARFAKDWSLWHMSRERTAAAPHGLASLVHTHWLTADPGTYEDAPGTWSAVDGRAVGAGLAGSGLVTADGTAADTVSLGHGDQLEAGTVLLRVMVRADAVALRVLDADSVGRAALAGIGAFDPDPAWITEAVFEPAEDGTVVGVTSIDGFVEDVPLAGRLRFELGGRPLTLAVTSGRRGLHAVFSDATSGDDTNDAETYHFRFLDTPAPDAQGRVAIDFNRAYVPPCSFADGYVCPLPLAENRLPVPVRAGERKPERAGQHPAPGEDVA